MRLQTINFQTNNKSPDIDCLIDEVYKPFSNELSSIILDVYDPWSTGGRGSVAPWKKKITNIFGQKHDATWEK